MFDRKDDPAYLQSCLESFISRWQGPRKPWFGIAAEKMESVRLPQPLRWFYAFAGEWPGRYYWDTLFGNADCLLGFESLYARDGKLVFVVENQAVWELATEREGDDPPVWAATRDNPWQMLCSSLTRFLVTFILHETVFGGLNFATSDGIRQKFTAAGMHVAPLWLDEPYPWLGFNGLEARPISFYMANGRYLIMDDDWCGTNEAAPWEEIPTIFQRKERPSATHPGFDPYSPMPEHLRIPAFLRQSHLKNAIRQHEERISSTSNVASCTGKC